MKIGIVTFTYGDNYGQRLQNFALQETLKEFGNEVVTLKQYYRVTGFRRMIYETKEILHNPGQYIKNIKRSKSFRKFNNKYINFSTFKIGENKLPQNIISKFDYFVCGSDQIWSPNTSDVNSTMFLDFAPREKRISYAPSIAAESIPENKILEYKKFLQGFNYLSLRENNLIPQIEKLTSKKVFLVLDPTLLHDYNFWFKVEEIPKKKPTKKYVVFYFLGESEKSIELQHKLRIKGYEIVDLMKDDNYYYEDPSSFLFFIHNADLVVTDSYHGTIFSIIYNVPFIIFNREDKNNMNSRFETLDILFNINNRRIETIEFDQIFKMDFSQINNKLKIYQKDSINYLKNALGKNIDYSRGEIL